MKTARIIILIFFIQLLVFTSDLYANGKATDTVSSQVRCSVCGMFVAKYPNWLAQIHYDDLEQAKFFDGVKDMMVLYFNPEQYEAPPREAINNINVKDYYSLNWFSAKDAFYVIGSDGNGLRAYIRCGEEQIVQQFLHNGVQPPCPDILRALVHLRCQRCQRLNGSKIKGDNDPFCGQQRLVLGDQSVARFGQDSNEIFVG
jgi:hypothetical protein